MDMPDEITMMILAYLPKKDLKQARLVCKQLAALGVHLLVDTVYISPRCEDMAVFDQITQHPVLSQSIRNLVYDSAQFVRCTVEEYYFNLYSQLNYPFSRPSIESNAAVKDLVDAIGWKTWQNNFTDKKHANDCYRRCEAHPAFKKGFRHWSQLASQQESLLTEAWITTACRGLKTLGKIHSVIIHNTWGTPSSFEGGVVSNYLTDVDIPCNHYETMHLGKSPTARAWPPTSVYPSQPLYAVRQLEALKAGGCVALLRVVQLLRLAGVQPVRLVAVDEWKQSVCGMPSDRLISQARSEMTKTQYLCSGLKALQLKISYAHDSGTSWRERCLHCLGGFLENALAVEDISLELPYEAGNDTLAMTYEYADIFPPFKTWRLDRLARLRLLGLTASARNFTGLLLLSFPNLQYLHIGHTRLTDGGWECIFEGLRRFGGLKECSIFELLLKPNGGIFGCTLNIKLGDDTHIAFQTALCRYVVHGGRHPCLPDTAPDEASDDYLSELKGALKELY
ncbi:MAG: hypothetical protein Q9201_002784 [Fulgogasparrea decipioides]